MRVMIVRGARRRGASRAGGSVVRTSNPAPAIAPVSRASARPDSSMSGPRDTLMSIASRRICLNSSRPMRPRVESLSGKCRLMMSLKRSSSSSVETLSAPAGKSSRKDQTQGSSPPTLGPFYNGRSDHPATHQAQSQLPERSDMNVFLPACPTGSGYRIKEREAPVERKHQCHRMCCLLRQWRSWGG